MPCVPIEIYPVMRYSNMRVKGNEFMRFNLTVILYLTAVLVVAPPSFVFAQSSSQQEGVRVGKTSEFAKLIPTEQVERAAAQQYQQVIKTAASKGELVGKDDPQVQRLRMIAKRILPFVEKWNPSSKQWRWEVILIKSKQINAWCMPGGKIAFYTGILETLKLTDDEVAMVMGHEIAHALREHARERMGKQQVTNTGVNIVSQLFGLGNLGQMAVGMGANLLTLKFSRDDESEADVVGIDIAARAGFDPRAGISLWKKMLTANKNAPPEWFSTHPSGDTRIREMEANLPLVMPLYQSAQENQARTQNDPDKTLSRDNTSR